MGEKVCRECWVEDPLYSLKLHEDTPEDTQRSIVAELRSPFTEVIEKDDEVLFYTDMRARHVTMIVRDVCTVHQAPTPWWLYRTHSHCGDEVLHVEQ